MSIPNNEGVRKKADLSFNPGDEWVYKIIFPAFLKTKDRLACSLFLPIEQLNHQLEKECPWNVVHSDSILLKQVMMAFEEIPTRCWDLSMKICSLWAINLPTIISSAALHCHVIVWLAVQRRCAIPFCNSNVIDWGASPPSLIAKLFASGRLILCDLTCDTWSAN